MLRSRCYSASHYPPSTLLTHRLRSFPHHLAHFPDAYLGPCPPPCPRLPQGVTSGFVAPPFGIMHCDTLQIFTRGIKGQEGQRLRGGALGLGLLLGGATFAHGHAAGCRTAEILAINDDDTWHERLVRYYSFFGFKPVCKVGGPGWAPGEGALTRRFGAKELWVREAGVRHAMPGAVDVRVGHCVTMLLERPEAVAWCAGVPPAAAGTGCGVCWRTCAL